MYGGASGISGMLHAARAIQAGDADVVVIVAADAFDVSSHMSMSRNPGSTTTWDRGATARPTVSSPCTRALHGNVCGHARGLRRLAVAQRENALLNPNALFKCR
jgi:acetyl-CoA acetyltransferase